MEVVLVTRGLSVAYGSRRALEDVSLEFLDRSVTAVVGPSGGGKTTLLHTLDGLLLQESPEARVEGKVLLDGRDVTTLPTEELRRQVGLVFQAPTPFPFSIWRNLCYVPRYHGVGDKARLARICEEKLRLVGLWDEVSYDLGRSALSLSGGQQQRLCIARALTAEPRVLLLDEPCSALDPHATEQVEMAISSLAERYAIVLVTHNLAQARRLAQRVVVICGGRVADAGEAGRVFRRPATGAAADFLSSERA